MLDRRQPVGRVHVHEVVAGSERAGDRLAVPAAQVGDVRGAHPPRVHRLVAEDGQLRRAERRHAPVEVGRAHAAVHELDPRERAVLVHLLDEPLVRRQVGVVPEPSLDEAADVGRGMDLDLLGADDGPASLRLDAAHPRVRRRVAVTHPVAVGNLEEAVARGDGAELHGLEEDVEARLAHQRKRLRAITSRMMSLVPSQISSSFASRSHFCTGESRM